MRYMVETEPEILCPLRRLVTIGSPYRLMPAAETTLFLPNQDSQNELEQAIKLLASDNFWLLDVRGLGEGLMHLDDLNILYGHDYMMAGYTMMLRQTLLGQRLADVLATVRLLRAEGAQRIHLAGRQQGALLALLAGLLDPQITSVACHQGPESFLALATAPYTLWPLVNFPRGVLRAFDLQEVRQALGARLVHDTHASPIDFGDPTVPVA
jgi:hypothetical protein